ncbi:MAG: protein kinase [Candidatus Dadabacteria bacterium]|nr:protein kinase [Candidatus Dadabacteria bacterium]
MSIFTNFRSLFKKGDQTEKLSFSPQSEISPFSMEGSQYHQDVGATSPAPDVSILDMAPKDSWELKKIKVWQKNDVMLGTYRVLDIKIGGMGYVYIAEHIGWKVKMAIKCPNEVMLSNKSYFARVLREADAWIGLGLYPHIAYCYYVRQIEGIPNIFIEYVDGGSLREWIIDRKCWDFRIGLDLCIQFCHGMHYAHTKGMVHRDIKPENILITNEGIVKITDFGIVMLGDSDDISDDVVDAPSLGRGGEESTRLTAIGAIMGSPSYMSPEQWEDSRSVDHRADIYSFGVCMYEMFCAQRPFKKTAIDAKDMGDRPAEPQELRSDLPPGLAELLKRCVEFDPDRRYKSFSEVGEELISIYHDIFKEDPIHKTVTEIGLKAGSLNNRAVSYMEVGREDEAVSLWEQSLREDPQHLETIFNYGYLKWQNLMHSDGAFITKLRELENAWGSSADYWRLLAWMYLEMGDFESVQKIQNSSYHVSDPAFHRAVESYRKPLLKASRIIKGSNWSVETITSLAMFRDGRNVITGSKDGKVRLWDITNGKLLRTFEGHDDEVNSVSVSPKGSHALSGSGDSTSIVWDLATRRLLTRLDDNNQSITCVRFSPNGKHVALSCTDSTIVLWNVTGEKLIHSFEGHKGAVFSLCFSPDGRYLASGSADNSIRVWDLKSGRLSYRLLGHDDDVYDLCYSPDGRYILSGSGDQTIRLWDVEGETEARRYKGHSNAVSCVDFSADGQYAVSGGWDKTVRMWKVATGLNTWHQAHNGKITSVKFFSGDRKVLSSCGEGNIVIWDVNFPERIGENVHPYPLICKVRTVAKLGREMEKVKSIIAAAKVEIKNGHFHKAYTLLKEGQQVPGYERDKGFVDLVNLCASWGNAKRKALKSAWQLKTLQGHSDWITAICFSPSIRHVLSGGWDKTVRLWDVSKGQLLKCYDETTWSGGQSFNVQSLQFSSNGRYAISGSWDKKIRLWEVMTGHELRVFSGHTGYVTSVSYSKNNRYVLSGSTDKTVRLWQVSTGKEVRMFEGHRDIVYSVGFSPDNRYAISSGDDNTIKMWDIVDNKLVQSFEGHYNTVFTTSFSPDGQSIISGSEDGTIRLWDVNKGLEVRRFQGHSSSISSVCFSPDGRFILSGSKDSTLRLWQVSSGKEVRRFEGHTGWITCVQFSGDGRYAVSGGWDNNIILWEFDWEWEM